MGGACSTHGERRVVYRVWRGMLKVRDNLEEPGVDGRIILRWGYGLDRAGPRYGQVTGTNECGNETSGSIKFGEFLD
jgi:hypothetical protein